MYWYKGITLVMVDMVGRRAFHLLLSVVLLLTLVVAGGATFNRSSFGKGFVFGTASASYQYEGAYNVDGRRPSIWDTYTHQHPERIADHSNGDVAVDQYHRYKEDVALMKDMGLDAYRFSISWSRVLPYGKLSRGVSQKGIQYYNNLINELLAKGLQPYVTLFHWDLPQDLEDEYGGFLSGHIVSDFRDYAELCFKEFGDRVKHWITLNEPWSFASQGYNLGVFAPGRCSPYAGNCKVGNSGTEPYIVGHNLILAHAHAVKAYRDKFQAQQKGEIGITLLSHWMVPFTHNMVNKNAAQRAIDFMFGWYMDPITFGDYPKSMKVLVGNRLPKFTKSESAMVKGSYDFLGLNYYTANYVAKLPHSNHIKPGYTTDSRANLTTEKNGIPIGQPTAASWLHVYPQGFADLLVYTKEKYKNPPIYITENGVGNHNDNSSQSMKEALNDTTRIDYYNEHLHSLLQAKNKNVDVRGYFAWSLLDNFEWADGYGIGFGFCYVDPKTLKRHPKKSFTWLKKFLLP